jgi:hypothetical protein
VTILSVWTGPPRHLSEALQHHHVRGAVGMAGNNLTTVAPLPMITTRYHCSRDSLASAADERFGTDVSDHLRMRCCAEVAVAVVRRGVRLVAARFGVIVSHRSPVARV